MARRYSAAGLALAPGGSEHVAQVAVLERALRRQGDGAAQSRLGVARAGGPHVGVAERAPVRAVFGEPAREDSSCAMARSCSSSCARPRPSSRAATASPGWCLTSAAKARPPLRPGPRSGTASPCGSSDRPAPGRAPRRAGNRSMAAANACMRSRSRPFSYCCRASSAGLKRAVSGGLALPGTSSGAGADSRTVSAGAATTNVARAARSCRAAFSRGLPGGGAGLPGVLGQYSRPSGPRPRPAGAVPRDRRVLTSGPRRCPGATRSPALSWTAVPRPAQPREPALARLCLGSRDRLDARAHGRRTARAGRRSSGCASCPSTAAPPSSPRGSHTRQ